MPRPAPRVAPATRATRPVRGLIASLMPASSPRRPPGDRANPARPVGAGRWAAGERRLVNLVINDCSFTIEAMDTTTLVGRVALVAGATCGAGRAIAVSLGEQVHRLLHGTHRAGQRWRRCRPPLDHRRDRRAGERAGGRDRGTVRSHRRAPRSRPSSLASPPSTDDSTSGQRRLGRGRPDRFGQTFWQVDPAKGPCCGGSIRHAHPDQPGSPLR